MTEIKLHTHGEKLIVSEKVTLASGNINSAELHVILDEAWAAYPNITASFETKEYVEPVDVLMTAKTATEYVCVIPAEVLQEQGTLEIAIRGVTNDGETAKTSTYAKYNIVRGASPGNITLKPTMDLYQQYLAAMEKAVAPAQDALLQRLDEKFEGHEAKVDEDFAKFKAMMCELMKPTTLWESPMPNNESEATALKYNWNGTETIKIPVDLSAYNSFVVLFYESYAVASGGGYYVPNYYGNFGSKVVSKNTTYTMKLLKGGNEKPVKRRFYLHDDEAGFYPAQFTASGSNTIDSYTSTGIGYLIPYKIIGFVY